MQYLLIGGVLIVFAGAAIVFVLSALATFAQQSGEKLGWLRYKMARWINRADLGLQATIPKAIESFSEKSLVDRVRVDLMNYEPIPHPELLLKVHKYQEQFSSYLTDIPVATNVVDIGSVPYLLNVDDRLPFQSLLNMESRNSPEFPESRPQGFGDIEQPPRWKPWVFEKVELNFSMPIYSGWKSIFNRYVNAAYAEEVNRVNRAKLNQLKMEECFRVRNEAMPMLQQQAIEKYDAAVSLSEKNWASACRQDKQRREAFEGQFQAEQEQINGEIAKINSPDTNSFACRVAWMLRTLKLPEFVPREGRCRYDQDSRILIFEHRLPDLSTLAFVKAVQLKAGWTRKPANQKEAKEAATRIYPSLAIRFAAEVRKLDFFVQVDAIVINGWADYIEQSTGQLKRAYCPVCLLQWNK